MMKIKWLIVIAVILIVKFFVAASAYEAPVVERRLYPIPTSPKTESLWENEVNDFECLELDETEMVEVPEIIPIPEVIVVPEATPVNIQVSRTVSNNPHLDYVTQGMDKVEPVREITVLESTIPVLNLADRERYTIPISLRPEHKELMIELGAIKYPGEDIKEGYKSTNPEFYPPEIRDGTYLEENWSVEELRRAMQEWETSLN